jgi:serine/threonine-protein kinase RsbW
MAKPPPTPDASMREVAQQRGEVDRLVQEILGAMERHRYSESSKFAVRLALEEAISNAFRHGHRDLPPETTVQISYRVGDRDLEFTVEDRGPGFNPDSVPDPTLDENLELPSGRGLILIRAYMTEVEYRGRGNALWMRYRRPLLKG